jgi:hypothetical protein
VNCKKEPVKVEPSTPIEVEQRTEETGQKEEITPVEIKDDVKIKQPGKAKKGLFFLEDLEGKYPTQEKIFQNKELQRRLKKIRRLNYDLLVQNWNTETPITIENQIIHSSGCKSHDCPSSAFELFIDLKNNNINVYHFSNNSLRVYVEKGWIKLPPAFAEELEIKKENAKIGSTSDDIESKYDINAKSSKK